jgi:DNA-binding HxlR family transcriptional regulator
MPDSERRKFWTLERAQGAIKAAFFAKEVLTQGSDAEPELRFSELQAFIGANERPIGDRTLSRAISALVGKGRLRKVGTRKSTVYRLESPREERVRAIARSDSSWLERSSQIGGIGDAERGFAFYGVPDVLREEYRPRLQRAALKHQAAIREILFDAWGDCIDAIVKPTRTRLPRAVWVSGRRAVERNTKLLIVGGLGEGIASRLWQTLEGTVPGALQTYQRTLGLSFGPETPMNDRLAIAFAKITGIQRGEIQPQIDRALKRAQADGERSQPLWEALTPRERERAANRAAAALAMTTSLTSVIHS